MIQETFETIVADLTKRGCSISCWTHKGIMLYRILYKGHLLGEFENDDSFYLLFQTIDETLHNIEKQLEYKGKYIPKQKKDENYLTKNYARKKI